jgi:hypothetical protein
MENDMDMFNDNRSPETTWQVIKKFIVLITICLVCVFCLYLSLPDNHFGFSPNVVNVSEAIWGDIPDHNFAIISQTKGDYSSNVSTIYYDGSTIMGDDDPEQLIVLDRSDPDMPRISAVVLIPPDQTPYSYLGVGPSVYLFSYQNLYFINLNDINPEVKECQLAFPENISDVVFFQGKVFAVDIMNTLYILDITKPSQPRMELTLEEDVWAKNLISPDIYQVKDLDVYRQYLVLSDQSRFHIFDFSNYLEPSEIGYYTPTTSFYYSYFESVSIIGDRAFIYEGDKHLLDPVLDYYLSIVDISNPQKPKRMSTNYYWPDWANVYGSNEDRVLIPTHLLLVDFTEKKNPQVIAHFNKDLNLSDFYYMIPGENDYFYVLDGERVITVRYQE